MPQITLIGQIAIKSETEEPQRVIVKSKRIPKQLAEETQYVLRRYFPELRGVLLYYTGSANGKYLYGWKIALNPDLLREPKRKLRHTIAHELTHLIQWQQDYIRHRALQTEYAYLYTQRIPKGEGACEIWTYARHPDLVAPSGYLHAPFKMRDRETVDEYWDRKFRFYEKYCEDIHELAKKAIELRAQGCRRYIKWFLNELKSLLR